MVNRRKKIVVKPNKNMNIKSTKTDDKQWFVTGTREMPVPQESDIVKLGKKKEHNGYLSALNRAKARYSDSWNKMSIDEKTNLVKEELNAKKPAKVTMNKKKNEDQKKRRVKPELKISSMSERPKNIQNIPAKDLLGISMSIISGELVDINKSNPNFTNNSKWLLELQTMLTNTKTSPLSFTIDVVSAISAQQKKSSSPIIKLFKKPELTPAEFISAIINESRRITIAYRRKIERMVDKTITYRYYRSLSIPSRPESQIQPEIFKKNTSVKHSDTYNKLMSAIEKFETDGGSMSPMCAATTCSMCGCSRTNIVNTMTTTGSGASSSVRVCLVCLKKIDI